MANNFKNKKADLTTTDLTTLYTVPSATTTVVKSLLVTEDAGSGTTITITLVNSSGTIFTIGDGGVPGPQGRRHRPGGRNLAGDLLPVLPRRRGGNAGYGCRPRRGLAR